MKWSGGNRKYRNVFPGTKIFSADIWQGDKIMQVGELYILIGLHVSESVKIKGMFGSVLCLSNTWPSLRILEDAQSNKCYRISKDITLFYENGTRNMSIRN